MEKQGILAPDALQLPTWKRVYKGQINMCKMTVAAATAAASNAAASSAAVCVRACVCMDVCVPGCV